MLLLYILLWAGSVALPFHPSSRSAAMMTTGVIAAMYILSMPYGLPSRYQMVVKIAAPSSPRVAPRLLRKNGREKPITATIEIDRRRARVKKDSFRIAGTKEHEDQRQEADQE